MRKLNVAKSFVRVWRPHRVLLFLLRLLFHLCEHFFPMENILPAVEEVKKKQKLTIILKVGKQK